MDAPAKMGLVSDVIERIWCGHETVWNDRDGGKGVAVEVEM